MLAVLGARIEKGRLFKVKVSDEGGAWRRQAERVMRRPVPYAVGRQRAAARARHPLLPINPGLSDDRVGPKDMSSRSATDQIRENFASREADALQVQLPGVDPDAGPDAIDAFARGWRPPTAWSASTRPPASTSSIDRRVACATRRSLRAVRPPESGRARDIPLGRPSVEPLSREGERLVADVRGTRGAVRVPRGRARRRGSSTRRRP